MNGATLGLFFSLVCQFLSLLNQQCQERMRMRCRAAPRLRISLYKQPQPLPKILLLCREKKKSEFRTNVVFCITLRDLLSWTHDDPWALAEFCEVLTGSWGAGGVPRPPAAKLYTYWPVWGKPCPLHALVCARWISFPYLLPTENLLEKLRKMYKCPFAF